MCLCVLSGVLFTQTPDDLLSDLTEVLNEETDLPLLPERILFTQRVFWGERGLFRAVDIAPKIITAESRPRKVYFKVYQGIGVTTAVSMAFQGYLGTKIYKPETYTDNLKRIHEVNATVINATYISTALLSFMAPPPAVNRKKFDNIKLHKYFSIVHMSGLITTNVLANRIDRNFAVNKKLYRAAASTTFGAYAAAFATIKIEF